jgi:type IV pilus assembly protein PilN
MYSLDVNFLKDRPEYRSDAGPRSRGRGTATSSTTPLILGIVAGILFPAVVAGLWFILQNKTAELQQQKDTLTAQNQQLDAQLGNLKAIQTQTDQIRSETGALASVFNQIKPWSAMLQDIRERVPPGVQLETIQQTAAPAAPAGAPAGAAPASSSGAVEISGVARSYNDVNDFLLTLQKSAFLKPAETKLVSATLGNNPTQIEFQGQGGGTATLPEVVSYKIQSSLSDVPASELLRELDRKGAVGLVTRIRTLQNKGVIQQ